MNTAEIRVNHDNFKQYDKSEDEYLWTSSSEFKESIDLSADIDRLLDECLGSDKTDWAGIYHGWLKTFGLDPETDNGWWSQAAFNPKNLQCFIADYTDTDFSDRLFNLRVCLPRGNIFEVKARHQFNNVLDMLIEAEKLQDA